MLDYFIKVLLFQTLFLAVYDLFLKKETFFQWNRAYLLVTSIAAYCIPMIKMNNIQQVMPEEYVIQLPEIMLSPTAVIEEKFDWSALLFDVSQWVFWIGSAIMAILFILKLTNLIRLIHKNEKLRKNKYELVFLDTNKAFSFFKYIFLRKDLDAQYKKQVIEHELVHVKQRHTLDLLFFELQKIICWFNPFSYLFQHRIAELHEFIADAKVVKDVNEKDYFQNLLAQTFGTSKISFINSFLKISLIKKRILMLNRNKSKELLRLKYLVLIPVLLSMFIYSSCEKKEEPIALKKNEKRTMIMYNGDGVGIERKEVKTKMESYFDVFAQGAKPSSGKEISYFDLTVDEQKDFQKFRKAPAGIEKEKLISEYKIYELADGRKALYEDIDFNSDELSFAIISKPPVFPGCEDAKDSKECFNLKLRQFVANNFNVSVSNELGLKPGKQRILVKFKIDKNGVIVDVNTRAPHATLEKEATRMILSVPKLQAGEKANGEKVVVNYVLPISFNVQ